MNKEMEKKINKPLKIKLNNIQNLEALLQEMYDETSKNINEIQNEINKLSMSTTLNDEIMDAKVKYAKAMNDYSSNKNKALSTKMDIAKLMAEVIKFNGNIKKMNEESEELPNWNDFIGTLNSKDDKTPKLPGTHIYKVN